LSEAELEENKAKHGERLEDGTFAGRTLREALAANKATKEQKFQDAWKQMKQGTLCYHTCLQHFALSLASTVFECRSASQSITFQFCYTDLLPVMKSEPQCVPLQSTECYIAQALSLS
jgi:hypothetical protein